MSEHFTGQDRFPAMVAFGVIFRDQGVSVLEAHDHAERWNSHVCLPPLDEAERRDAVDFAYDRPEIAARIVGAPVPTERQGHAAPTRSPAGRAIVETTASSSLTVAALVDATTPANATTPAVTGPPVGTTSECVLCAARRKAKRERTRRSRARMRSATQPMRRWPNDRA
jgi:hypothetical protein